jgi:hypothetical protein
MAPPDDIISFECSNPVLFGKIGESWRNLTEQKICPRWNWTISQFLVVNKTGKIIHFCRKTSQNTNFPICPSKSFFSSKTSLYKLKWLLRLKKNCQNNYGTLLTTVSNHCAWSDFMRSPRSCSWAMTSASWPTTTNYNLQKN